MCSGNITGSPTIGTPVSQSPVFRPPALPPTAFPSGNPVATQSPAGSKPASQPTGVAVAGPTIPPAPTLTAMLIGESLTPKVGVEQLKHPLIVDDPNAIDHTDPSVLMPRGQGTQGLKKLLLPTAG